MKLNRNEILNVEYKENVEISQLTTIKTKGYVKGVFYPKTERELITTYMVLQDNNINFIVVGNGSNLLISPKADIVVISTRKLKQSADFSENEACFSSSVTLAKAYNLSYKIGLSGFEALAGIPATIGGAVKNNASAFGHSIFDILEIVRIFKNGKICELKKQDIFYSYHSTNLNGTLILSAKFRLSPEKTCKITQDFVEYQKIRTMHQPKGFSCGSVFKNPPNFSAGYLIEECGLKGKACGGARISDKHANFIITDGNASYKDVVKLIDLCKKRVKTKYEINLETEAEIIE